MLRTNVEFAKGDESINSFCVLSSGAGEGKSFTVSNLACVYAQHGSRVLVVDSDLRRPNIHKMFNLPNEAGIAEYLIGSKTLEEVIQPTSVANVWVITAGTRSDAKAALPLLSGQRMTDLIQELGRRYQVVLYDTPPVLGASDAAVLAREIGLSILVVQHRRYPRTMPRRARQIIENAGGKILGVVVNNVNLGQADTYYYYHDQYEYYLRAPDRRLHVAGAKGKPEEEGIKFTEKY
jgi:capsular exopolysaccharide synthesis family protein